MNPDELLKDYFGFSEFRKGQREVINSLLNSGKSLAVFPTGGGKSICYQLTALLFEGVTVVVSPLIALMKDQIDYLRSRNVAAARLDSTLTLDESHAVMDGLQNGTLKLLYVAPERFNNERFLAALKRTKIALFAIDEAHCISAWGHNFRPDYLKLADTAKELGVERVLALTATATPSVVEDICAAFDIKPEDAHVTGFYRANLNLAITTVRADERDALLVKRLKARKPGPAIVYVTLQKTATQVAELLLQEGFEAAAYHAGMESEERSRVQESWMASDRGIVVATIAFGMGIDKANVRYVYHYNLPKSLESYSQEIGRAGRDGLKSTVELLACPEDVPVLDNFTYGDTPPAEALEGLMRDVLERGEEFSLDMYDLSYRYDLRMLVLRTSLTYLELCGVIRQGTPYYAGYDVLPKISVDDIVANFIGEHAKLVKSLFMLSKRGTTLGKTKYSLNPDTIATALQQERKRVVRALEVMEQKGYVELKPSDVQHRYTSLKLDADPISLAEELAKRFLQREQQDILRLQQVMSLATLDSCLTNELIGYFGEAKTEPCGHCSYCMTGKPQRLPESPAPPPISQLVNRQEADELQAENHEALGQPRQMARFLCGLSSPATSRKRLGRHRLFGILESRSFKEVIEWISDADSLRD